MRQRTSLHRRFLNACASLAHSPAPTQAPKTNRLYRSTPQPWIHRPPTHDEIRALIDQVEHIRLTTGYREPANPPPTRKPPAPAPVARPAPITATLRTRLTTCGKPACTTCPHGPYLYATIRSPANRIDVSLGRHPNGATFYRRLIKHLPAEMIHDLIQEWRSTC